MSRNFVAKLEGFVAEHEIPLVQFRKGQNYTFFAAAMHSPRRLRVLAVRKRNLIWS